MEQLAVLTEEGVQVDPGLRKEIAALAEEAKKLKIINPAAFEEAGLILHEATKLGNKVDAQRKAVQVPYKTVVDDVNKAAKPYLDVIEAIKDTVKKSAVIYVNGVEYLITQAANSVGPEAPTYIPPSPKSAFLSIRKKTRIALLGETVPYDYMTPDMAKIEIAAESGLLPKGWERWVKVWKETTVQSTGK